MLSYLIILMDYSEVRRKIGNSKLVHMLGRRDEIEGVQAQGRARSVIGWWTSMGTDTYQLEI